MNSSCTGLDKGFAMQYQRLSIVMTVLWALAGLCGCASTPPAQQRSAAGPVVIIHKPVRQNINLHPGLAVARDMLGAPYRYGGADPQGFDCSGLVYYAYRTIGMEIPRTTTQQFLESKRVQMSRLEPGDLLFFNISRDKLSHVGIYSGDGRFIHAPSSGKSVSYASLDDPYWQGRLIGTGRFQ